MKNSRGLPCFSIFFKALFLVGSDIPGLQLLSGLKYLKREMQINPMTHKPPEKLIVLMSGGIDSPVAAHLVLESGFDIIPLHFDNSPFTDAENEKRVLDLLERLQQLHPGQVWPLIIVDHGKNLIEFANKAERKLNCIFCRRMMFRIASEFAKEKGAVGIVTGESLGQVASQTLPNLMVVSQASKYPLIRPLLSYDKNDISAIARKIGTFDISTRPIVCCRIVPERPETRANMAFVEAEETKVDVPKLVHESVKNARRLD